MERDKPIDNVRISGFAAKRKTRVPEYPLVRPLFLLLFFLFISSLSFLLGDETMKPADMVLHHWKEGGAIFKVPPNISVEREDSQVFQGSSESIYFFVGKIDSPRKPFDLVAETYWETFAKKNGVLQDDFRNTVNGYNVRGLAGHMDGFPDPVSLIVLGIHNPYGNDFLLSLMFRGIKAPTPKTRSIFQEVLSSFAIVP